MYEREGATCVAFTVVAPIFFKANSGVGLNSKLRARDKPGAYFSRGPLWLGSQRTSLHAPELASSHRPVLGAARGPW